MKKYILIFILIGISTLTRCRCSSGLNDALPEDKNETCAIIEYSIIHESVEYKGSIYGNRINVYIPEGVILDTLTAYFVSTGVGVSVNNIPQISGVSTNNFNAPVYYHIVAEDGETWQDFIVTVLRSYKWMRCFGGDGNDTIENVIPLSGGDGGYIFIGKTNSNPNSDVPATKGATDGWIAKVDKYGVLNSKFRLGGFGDDFLNSATLTSDGGYLLVGHTTSGELPEYHGGTGGDAWIVKVNAAGEIVWQKCFGGTADDTLYDIRELDGGNLIAVGQTNSDMPGQHNARATSDIWVIKLNSAGDILWQKCLGGTWNDLGFCVQPLPTGDFILSGYTNSNNGDVSGNHGGSDIGILRYDAWIVKLNASGEIVWQKCRGGTFNDLLYTIQQLACGNFIAAGYTFSNDKDVSGNHGSADAWVVELNSIGDIVWQKCLGGSSTDTVKSLQQLTNGNFIVAGNTLSDNGDVSGYQGSSDAWVVRLNSTGGILWQKCLGASSSQEAANFIQSTADGGFVVVGTTSGSGLPGYHGGVDGLIFKLDANGRYE